MSTPRRAGRPARSSEAAPANQLGSRLRAELERTAPLVSAERLIALFTVLALAGALLLIVAEFVDLFNVKQGGTVIFDKTTGDHHSYAMLVVGAAVAGAALACRATEAWPPAAGIVVLSLIALAIVLIGDLPDATSSGLTANLRTGNADPAAGLWLELGGALCALGSGLALALLLRALSLEALRARGDQGR